MSPGERPRIPRDQARRIDRLARRAHRFHRWAHHPLCAEYEGEVVRLGRKLRLCRGCLLAGCGAAAGSLLGLLAPLPLPALALGGAAALLFLLRGRSKWLTRFAPLLLAGAAVGAGLRAWTWQGVVLAAGTLGLLVLVLVAYRRRGPSRRPCAACPELGRPGGCRGTAEILRRERAFSRLAARIYSGSGR